MAVPVLLMGTAPLFPGARSKKLLALHNVAEKALSCGQQHANQGHLMRPSGRRVAHSRSLRSGHGVVAAMKDGRREMSDRSLCSIYTITCARESLQTAGGGGGGKRGGPANSRIRGR